MNPSFPSQTTPTALLFTLALLVGGATADDLSHWEVRVEGLGASAPEMEALAALPLEAALADLDGLGRLDIRCQPGVCILRLELTSIDGVRQRLSAAELPEWMEAPQVEAVLPEPLLEVVISSEEGWNLADLTMVAQSLVEELQRLPGAGRVEQAGTATPILRLELASDRLTRYGLTVREVVNRLHKAGVTPRFDGSGWSLEGGGHSADVTTMVIGKGPEGSHILLIDVAELRSALRLEGRALLNGQPAIWLGVRPAPGADREKLRESALQALKNHLAGPKLVGIDVRATGPANEGIPGLDASRRARVWAPPGTDPAEAFEAVARLMPPDETSLVIQPPSGELLYTRTATAIDQRLASQPGLLAVADEWPAERVVLRASDRGALGAVLPQLEAAIADIPQIHAHRALGLSPWELWRQDGQPAIMLQLWGEQEALATARERLQALELPPGVELGMQGLPSRD